MVANYPYFGLPNYMRYVNSNYCSPNDVKPRIVEPCKRFDMPNSRQYYQSFYNKKKSAYSANSQKRNFSPAKAKLENCKTCDSPVFSLLGIDLYFDDVLLVLIIFFLYTENVNDPYLFITLVLLLLT